MQEEHAQDYAPVVSEELRELDPEVLALSQREREYFIDNLLVRIHFIIEMIWWTGLAPWECEFPFPGSLISTFDPTKPSYSTVWLGGR